MKKIIALLLILSFSFSGCEKDDICDANTITTPRLVITFYDINNSSVEKNVTNLTIIADGMENAVSFNGTTLINGSTVSIPLKADANTTTFRFILNFGNENPLLVNEDIIKFNYSRENIFVSRACGFKTNYILNTDSPNTDPPFEHTDLTTPESKWMQYVAVKNSIIANENETHLEIFF